MEWLTNFIQGISWQQIAWGAALFVVTFTISIAAVGLFVVLLPPTFFLTNRRREFMNGRHPALRWTAVGLKNLLGLSLVVVGVGLSLPGMPGQGLLTILIGLILMDFPGKRKLERKIIGRPKVLGTVNRLRARFNKPPLLLDEEEEAKPTEADTAPTEGEASLEPKGAAPADGKAPPPEPSADRGSSLPERTPAAKAPDKR